MVDLHCHVLPGVDDGPPDVAASLALARAAASTGTTTLVATPHVVWDLPHVTAARVADETAALARALRDEGVGVELRTGGEVAIDRAAELPDEELRALRLGGGEWLLCECPLSASAAGFDVVLRALQARGHRIVLAHPERSPAVRRDPALLRALVDAGMLSSITAGSLRGQFGAGVREHSLELLEQGLVHNLVSDAHDAVRRPPGLADALLGVEDELPGVSEQLGWLTEDVPAAILGGAPVPPRPVPAPRRRRSVGRRLAAALRRGG